MTLITNHTSLSAEEITITEFINMDFGHFITACDDRIITSMLRRTIVTELGLPSNCMTIVTNIDRLVNIVKEMCVRKKTVVSFIQTTFNNKPTDDIIKQIGTKLNNCKTIVIATEHDTHILALLREFKAADSWIIKPIAVNQLINTVASVIKPHKTLEKLVEGAKSFLQQGSFQYVLNICQKIIETHPNNAATYMLMGDAYRGLGMREEMIEKYEHACHVEELFLEPLHRLVAYFREHKDNENELLYLEKLDAVSPLNTNRKMEIAKIHLELGHKDEASATFDSLIQFTTKSIMNSLSETATQIGNIYAEKHDPEAEKYFRKAIDVHSNHLDKSHTNLFNNLGIHLTKNNKWKDAVVEFKKALSLDPENDSLYYNLALAYDAGNDCNNAQQCITDALTFINELYKNDTVVSANIGMILSKVEKYDESMRYLHYALEINPDNKQAQNILAALESRTDNN